MELFTSTLPHIFIRPVILFSASILSSMLNRFKSAFYNVVNNIDSNLSPEKGLEAGGPNGETKLTLKFPYTRPHFLQLNGEDEIQLTGDHAIRPIIVPRDLNKIPWNSGYAEAVNAGKSARNEDQARIHVGYVERATLKENGHAQEAAEFQTPPSTPEKNPPEPSANRLPYVYFGIFDGHAGTGAAIAAANQLHHIVHEKLMDVIDHLLPPIEPETAAAMPNQVYWYPEKEISMESFVVGALESAFHEMDELIASDRFKYRMTGGCTALASLFIGGKLFVANAGDSRATLCRGKRAFPLSNDFTPESERQRLRKLASLQPELLGGEYTALDFTRRPNRRDVGHRLLCREPHMTGWSYKVVTPDDLKFPLIYGEGKRSRVLATIGVTRGFGDHDLKAPNSNILIKPFLSSQPEVRIVDLEKETIYPTDVLVMGTDGLWDVTSNERAAEVVHQSLEHFPLSDTTRYRYRFTSAAQDLVMSSRGKLVERNWRTSDGRSATIDDISVFVIPLLQYKEEFLQWKIEQERLRDKDVPGPSGYVSLVSEHQVSEHSQAIDEASNSEQLQNSAEILDESVLRPDPAPQQVLPEESEPVTSDETASETLNEDPVLEDGENEELDGDPASVSDVPEK